MTRATTVVAACAVALVSPGAAFGQEGWIPSAGLNQGPTWPASLRDQRRRNHARLSIGQEIAGGLVATSTIGQPIGPSQRPTNPAIVVVLSGVNDSSVTRLQTQPDSRLNRVSASSTTASQTSSPASTSSAAALAGPADLSTPVANTRSLPPSAQTPGATVGGIPSQVRTDRGAADPSRGRRSLVENGLARLPRGSTLVGSVVGPGLANVPSAVDISAPVSTRVNSTLDLGQVGGFERTLGNSIANPVGRQTVGLLNGAAIGRSVGGAAPGTSTLIGIGGQVGVGAATAARSTDILGQVGGSTVGLPRSSGPDRRGG